MTAGDSIRLATPGDAALLNRALRALSAELGDTHRADAARLRRALSPPYPSIRALLAEGGEGVVGATIFSPLFSTTRGMAGAYVSDLWVSPSRRGQSLGARLLREAAVQGRLEWDAGFLRLAVYSGNADAARFYRRLGFQPSAGETWLTLEEEALDALKGMQ